MGALTYRQIVQSIQQDKYASVYFLTGEETFFIDEIERLILQNALQPAEKDFNLDLCYGKDLASINDILTICRQYPVFAERRIVVVREAQYLNRKDQWMALSDYLEQPLLSTILIILFKHKKLDKRWEVTKKIMNKSVYLESDRLREYEVAPWIKEWLGMMDFEIDDWHAKMIADNLGNDLSRVANELEKLKLALPKGAKITADDIEKYIGISREYNTLELSDAVQRKDIAKAISIINYFSKNPKSGPFPLVIGILYAFFSKLWLFYQLQPNERSNMGLLMKILRGGANGIVNASRLYSPDQAEKAIALLAEYDVKSKGVDNRNTSEYGLMLELVHKLMH